MALPRRCKHCRCYIAPQLRRCPRCNRTAPSTIIVRLTREERAAQRAKLDSNVPVIHAKNIRWAPSTLAVQSHTRLLAETQRKMSDADTPQHRNALRSEIRLLKAFLANANHKDAKTWTHEIFHSKYACIPIFLSPKGNRYVLADKEGKADLILEHRKKVGIGVSRLQRFEKSRFAKMVKADKQQEASHKKRKVAKKVKRVQHKKILATLS